MGPGRALTAKNAKKGREQRKQGLQEKLFSWRPLRLFFATSAVKSFLRLRIAKVAI
jgi:hypothetical protein